MLDDFFVVDARTGTLPEAPVRERFEKMAVEILVRGADPARFLKRSTGYTPLYRSVGGEVMPTSIRFDNAASEGRTLIEIETEDRLGLLHAISQALAELRLDIAAARIVTERGAAERQSVRLLFFESAARAAAPHPRCLRPVGTTT